MNANGHVTIVVSDSTQVGAARRAAVALSRQAGLDETCGGRVALATTELATNLDRHAKDGLLLLRVVGDQVCSGVELIAIDRGPGMANVELCMVDGFTTGTSPGTGLGAVRRAATDFDVHSVPGAGTVLMVRVFSPRHPPPVVTADVTWSAVAECKRGEDVCGDSFATVARADDVLFLVADGLGHGPLAADAAKLACDVLRDCADAGPGRVLELAHERLRRSRGAAVAVGSIRRDTGAVRYAGMGNISTRIVNGAESRSLVSQNGTVGLQIPKPREFDYVLPRGALLVAHSDGIGTRWDLTKDPRLASRDPAIVAGALLRDHSRRTDDATVLVGRRGG